MLSISRKKGQSFIIGDDVEVYISDVYKGNVRIGIKAPKEVKIMRKELLDREREAAEEAQSDVLIVEEAQSDVLIIEEVAEE